MARNQEKAQSMLYRFRESQRAELGLSSKPTKRPHLASLCDNLRDAEKWRTQILKEIGDGIMKLNSADMEEWRIREINDNVNKLFREKGHWERRIIELGGPNYRSQAFRIADEEGVEVPGGQHGYKYFGRAKELPGVKELFGGQAKEAKGRTRNDMMRFVDAEYFGYRDEDDGTLLEYEREWEEGGRSKANIRAKRASRGFDVEYLSIASHFIHSQRNT